MKRALLLPVALALAAVGLPAAAQNFPDRTITMIVPFAPGGATDGIARIVADGMSKRLGQTVVVENVGGAGGTLGIAKAKNAAADGYTIALGHFGTHAAAVALYRKLPYDPVADIVPVAWVASASIVLSARKDIPAANHKEFIAYARQQGETPRPHAEEAAQRPSRSMGHRHRADYPPFETRPKGAPQGEAWVIEEGIRRPSPAA